MLDIENTVHNNRDSETGKKNKKNRNDNGDRKKLDSRRKERKQLRFQQYQESKKKGNGWLKFLTNQIMRMTNCQLLSGRPN